MRDDTSVLLIDDDEDDFVLVRDMLREARGPAAQLDYVPTFDAGLDALLTGSYAVGLVDYRLGERNGLELLRTARDRGCATLLILLTGLGGREVEDEALASGAADYLPKKQLSPEMLDRSIRYAIERQRSRTALTVMNAQLEERVRLRTTELEGANQALRREIAERRRIELDLRLSEERYRLAVAEARGVVYDWDPLSGYVSRSGGVLELLGFEADEVPSTSEWWMSRVHPDDRPGLGAKLTRTFEECASHLESEYRVARRDGRWVHVWERMGIIRDEDGRVVRVVGHVVDISARKQDEARLRDSEAHFRLLAEAMPQIVWTASADGRVTYMNERCAQYVTGAAERQSLIEAALPRMHPDDREGTQRAWALALATTSPFDGEFRLARSGGEYCWFLARAVPLMTAAGHVAGWFGTATGIDDQKRAQETLRETDRRKDQFLATLAHELRNPLAPVRTGLEFLQQSAEFGPDQLKLLQAMQKQVQHMVRLIDDLLDISRINLGKVELKRQRSGLVTIVEEALETCRPTIQERRHQLDVRLHVGELQVDGDPVRLSQIISNLVGNAAKFTPEGGRLTLDVDVDRSSSRLPSTVIIRVGDSGVGIAPEVLPHVFTRFVQGNGGADGGGIGLGLSLVKHFVELHGGSVSAHSEGAGKGSVFEVRLPIGLGEVQPEAQPEPAAAVRADRRVVIVDDNRDAADSLALLLKLHGYDTGVAYDGHEALEVVDRFRPDVALVDLGLPGLDGYEVARRIRQAGQRRDLVLIALTGYGRDSDRERSREAGFDAHLVKPVNPSELIQLIAGPATAPVS